jgi:hypothetical protein
MLFCGFLLLILYLFKPADAQTSEECIAGCLVCSKTKVCLLCDFTTNLYLMNGKCSTASVEFCEVYNFDGACLTCKANYYLEAGACRPVPPAKLESSTCAYYDSSLNSCFKCRAGSYLRSPTSCVTITKVIEFCLTYGNDGLTCINCGNSTLPDSTFVKCRKPTKKDEDCNNMGYLTCLECKPGYMNEPNSYIMNAFFSGKDDLNVNYINIRQLMTTDNLNLPTCRKLDLLNCEEYSRFDQCKKCMPSFFLTNTFKCQAFPEPKIDNCEVYSSATTCKTCLQGFYKKMEDECAPVLKIDNCKTHSRVINSLCEECESSFYIYNNACQPRVASKSIANCNAVFVDRDLCKTCASNFVLSLDFASCLKGVDSCRNHVILEGNPNCSECFSGFYLTNDYKCQKGGITGCDQYSSDTECSNCMTGFYVGADRKSCQKHNLDNVLSCSEFSTVNQNSCDLCISSQVRFSIENICMTVDAQITNCVVYSDSQTCAQCNSTISYLANNKCVLGTVKKCILYHATQNICLKCENDPTTVQALIPNAQTADNQCVQGNPNLYFNCKEIDDSIDRFCSFCDTNFYPISLSSVVYQYCLPNDYSGFPANPKVANCTLFDQDNNLCKICNTNATGFTSVSHQGVCIEQCPTGTQIQTFEFDTNRVSGKFLCKAATLFSDSGFQAQNGIGCFRFDYDQNGKWTCAECANGFIAVFDATLMSQKYLRYSYLLTASTFSYYHTSNKITPIFSCLATAAGTVTTSTATKLIKPETAKASDNANVDNCYIIAQVPTTDFYACSRCKFGYSGKIVRTQNSKGYMPESCKLIVDCKVDIWYNGLAWKTADITLPLDYYMNCHTCNTINNIIKIPTSGISSKNYESISPSIAKNMFGPFGAPSSNTPDEFPVSVDPTLHITQTSCQNPGLTQGSTFPANCGAQILFIDKKLSPYRSAEDAEVNPVCVICQPKFMPSAYSTASGLSFVVMGCDPINKCVSSITFNSCDQCDTGFALFATSQGYKCVSTTVENCYKLNADLACILCNKGYMMSADGTCDRISAYKCSDNGFYTVPDDINDMISHHTEGIGCQKCENKFVLLSFKKPQQICVRNKFIEQKGSGEFVSKIFMPNCDFFGLTDSKVVCKKCKAGFVAQANGRACISETIFPNCKTISNGATTCSVCIDQFYYDSSVSSCVKGSINNCVVYQNKNNCATCLPGYLATGVAGGRTLCFSTESLNCASIDPILGALGTLKCQSCNPGYFMTTNSTYGSFPLKTCLKVPEIPNCMTYNKNTDVSNSFLSCVKCSGDFYLNSATNTCVKRSGPIANCLTLSPNTDTCQECSIGFYAQVDGKSCIANSQGVYGCIDYINLSTCTKCDTNMYLENNICKPVNATQQIKNCRYYKSSFECSQCMKNFFLNGNVCELALASNCRTFKDSKTCETCEKNFGLSRSVNITSCLLIQVRNCEIPDSNSMGPNFLCLKCAPNYYLNSTKLCSPIATKIGFCKYYKDDKTCMECESSLLLSEDGQKCQNFTFLATMTDPYCTNTQIRHGCSTCKPGHMRNHSSGLCAKCPNNTLEQNCWQCNPYNTSECLMCKSGSVHKANRVCSGANFALTGGNSTNNTNNSATNKAVIESIQTVLVAALLLLMIDK